MSRSPSKFRVVDLFLEVRAELAYALGSDIYTTDVTPEAIALLVQAHIADEASKGVKITLGETIGFEWEK